VTEDSNFTWRRFVYYQVLCEALWCVYNYIHDYHDELWGYVWQIQRNGNVYEWKLPTYT